MVFRRKIAKTAFFLQTLINAFGNALGNSIVAKMSGPVGLTAEQKADMAHIGDELMRTSMGDTGDRAYADAGRQLDQWEFERRMDDRVQLLAQAFNETLDAQIQASVKAPPQIRFEPQIDPMMAAQARGLSAFNAQVDRSLNAIWSEPVYQTTAEMRPLNAVDSFLMGNPAAQGALGFLTGVADLINIPKKLGEGLQNLERDAYGFTKAAITGESYQAQNGVVRLYQEEGAGAGTVDLIRGTVTSLPVLSTLSAGDDPFAIGRSFPGGLLAAAPLTLARVGVAGGGVWKLNPFQRGQQIEQALEHNLPGNFPVIDRFENGLATSIKSIDLDAATYQNSAALGRTLTGHVDKVADFQGRTWAGVRIRSQDISGRALDLVIPHSGSAAQQAIIGQTVNYGVSRGVTVNVLTYP